MTSAFGGHGYTISPTRTYSFLFGLQTTDHIFCVVTMWSPALGREFTLIIRTSYIIDIMWKFGAGEANRTPDPNLGKVMLYP